MMTGTWRWGIIAGAVPSDFNNIDEARATVVGKEDAASEDASYASLAETVLSVCSQVDFSEWAIVEGVQDTRSTYVEVLLSHLAQLYAINIFTRAQAHTRTRIYT